MPTPGAAPSPDFGAPKATLEAAVLPTSILNKPGHETALALSNDVEVAKAAGKGVIEGLDESLAAKQGINRTESKRIIAENGGDPNVAVAEDLPGKLIEGGFSSLDATPGVGGKSQQDIARELAVTGIRADPQIRNILDSITDPVEKAAVEKAYLENPRTLEAIKARYRQAFPEGATVVDEVTPAEKEVKRLETERAAKETERDRLAKELQEAEERKSKYEDPSIGVPKARARLTLAEIRMKKLEGDVRRLLDQEGKLRPGDTVVKEDLNRQMLEVTTQMTTATDEINACNDEINIDGTIRDLQVARDAAETGLTEAATNKNTAQVALDVKAKERDIARAALKAKAKTIISDGVKDYVRAEAQDAETARQARLTAEANATTDAGEKAVVNQEKSRYDKVGGKPGEVDVVLEENDWLKFMDPTKGPKANLKDWLTAEAAKDKSLTTAVARAVFVDSRMNNQAFVDKMLPRVSQATIAARLRSGHVLTEGEGEFIINNAAIMGEKVIDHALDQNQNLKKEIDALKKKGVIHRSVLEFLKEKKGKDLIKWLLIIFGTAGLATMAINKGVA
jgi:hypothetical protein